MRVASLHRSFLFVAALLSAVVVKAQTVVSEADIVRQPENTAPTKNWVGYTRTGTPPTALQFVIGPGNPPMGCGSVMLSTLTDGEKVFLYNFDHKGTKLSEVGEISYATYRLAKAQGQELSVAAIHVVIEFDVAGGKDTAVLVFEPAYSPEQGVVMDNVWQTWEASGEGVWWSTEPINGQCAGAYPQCYRSWDEIVADNPNATVVAVGINQGSGNPGLISAVDAFNFDGTVYNFEPSPDTDGDGTVDACDNDDDNDGVPDAHDCAPTDAKNDKVIVCHNGKEICISQNAVEQHMKHGDNLGPCVADRMLAYTKTNNRFNSGEIVESTTLLHGTTPNPFSSRTTFRFNLLSDSRVAIRVFDVMGREVGSVSDGWRKAGQHTAEFNAAGLQEGIYFYRITISSGSRLEQATGTMILKR